MWAEESTFYQIYPLGFCGAPLENDGICVSRIAKVLEWIQHMKKLGIGAIYFSPLFESDTHGYDTRDFRTLDVRLGTNEDFLTVCQALHKEGIRIVLDGVFHHVGRGFWAFQDVLKNREQSAYCGWFYLNFQGNSSYNDGFWYEGWEGHYELVKLNLQNPEVVDYLMDCIKFWIDMFDIDGLRLDVAYSLSPEFMRRLHDCCKQWKADFYLIGEVLFGDYNRIVNDQMLNSCTNYECYKGLYSSFNELNLFEIAHSLNRQFGPENWTLYRGKHLVSFVDNHDVTRIASQLKQPKHLPLIYGLLFGMPGIPCLYYGSEWGAQGEKQPGSDASLRPFFQCPEWNDLTDLIAALISVRANSEALVYGEYRTILLTNRQLIFERKSEHETIWILINAEEKEYHAALQQAPGTVTELLSKRQVQLSGSYCMKPYHLEFWRL